MALLLVSTSSAQTDAQLEIIFNPFTGQLQYAFSSNQSGFNITANNFFGDFFGNVTGNVSGVATVINITGNATFANNATFADEAGFCTEARIMNYTGLQNYPIACPAGSAITQLDDIVTCTAFDVEDNDWIIGDGILFNNTNGTFVGIGTDNPIGLLDVGTNRLNITNNESTLAANASGFYQFEEGSGTNASDSSGGENHGNISGAVFNTSKGGNGTGLFALDFDGVDDIVTVLDDDLLQNIFDGGGTVTAWIFPRSGGEANTGRIAKKSSSTANGGWFVSVIDPTSDDTRIRFKQEFTGGGAKDGIWKNLGREIILNDWTHIAVVYDNGDILNDPTFYINGSEVAIQETLAPKGTRGTDVGQNLLFGNTVPLQGTFDGIIDEISIFNRSLTSSEILDIFNNGINTSVISKLVNQTVGGSNFLVREDGHINVTGTTANSTFEGDVQIKGTLHGGSPLKIAGGLNVGGDITGTRIVAEETSDSIVGNLQVLGNLTGSSPLNIIGGVRIISGDFSVRDERGDFINLLTTLRKQRALIDNLTAEIKLLKSR